MGISLPSCRFRFSPIFDDALQSCRFCHDFDGILLCQGAIWVCWNRRYSTPTVKCFWLYSKPRLKPFFIFHFFRLSDGITEPLHPVRLCFIRLVWLYYSTIKNKYKFVLVCIKAMNYCINIHPGSIKLHEYSFFMHFA